jgi:hypothetical protein
MFILSIQTPTPYATGLKPIVRTSPRASASHLLKNVMGQKTGESVMEKILLLEGKYRS